jgi:acyl-CoA synthetase (NDP forming)
MVDACRMGVPFLVVTTGGFDELGEAGRALQARVDTALQSSTTRLVGPNCSGIWNVHGGVYLTLSQNFVSARRVDGPIALITQSGGLGRCFMDRGLDVGYWLSTGNNADLNEADYLNHLAERPEVETIVLILEGLRNVACLRAALARTQRAGKRVVAMKSGRSEVGQAAAQSHTGALKTDARLVEAMFRQHGVIAVNEIDEAADVAALIAVGFGGRRPPRTAICAFSGGSATVLADACGEAGLPLARLATSTRRELRAILPGFASWQNPVDLTTHIYQDYSLAPTATALLAADPGVDVIIFAFTSRTGEADSRIAAELVQLRASGNVPRLVAVDISADHRYPEWAATLAAAGTPYLRGAGQAVRAILRTVQPRPGRSGRWVAAPPPRLHLREPGPLGEAKAKQLLAQLGLSVPPGRWIENASQVAAAAAAIGYPVVLKADVPGTAHKTELGLVETAIGDRSALDAALARLLEARRRNDLGSEGYLLEKSIGDGVDFIVGLEQDSVFAYSIMLGSGGVLAEVIDDACFCILPTEPAELARLPALTYSRLLLPGFRGAPPADLRALLDVLQVMARLPDALPPGMRIACEINPLRVMPEGLGAWVLDAKLRIDV